jgi:hypothetical protein
MAPEPTRTIWIATLRTPRGRVELRVNAPSLTSRPSVIAKALDAAAMLGWGLCKAEDCTLRIEQRDSE